MGYYSQVALIVKKEDAIALINKAIERTRTVENTYCLPIVLSGCGKKANYTTEPAERLNAWVKQAEDLTKEINSNPNEKTLFYWADIKWYYDDVERFIKPFYQRLDYYEFLRIGEEEGDIERDECNSDMLLGVCQSIDIDESAGFELGGR